MRGPSRKRGTARAAACSAALALSLGLAFPAQAQTQAGVAVQQFLPAPGGEAHYVNVRGAGVLDHLRPSFGAYLNYAYRPLVLTRVTADGRAEVELLAHHLQLDLLAALGLYGAFQVELALPLTPFETEGRSDLFTPRKLSTLALGDVRLSGTWRAWGGGEGLALAVVAVLTLPTGSVADYQGNGFFTFEPGAVLEYRPGPRLRAALNLGYVVRSPRQLLNLNVGNELVYAAAFAFESHPKQLAWIAEVYGRATLDPRAPIAPETVPLELGLSARWTISEGHALTTGLARGITDGYGSPALRIFAGYTFTDAPPGDSDQDGVLDRDDLCPHEIEDRDGHNDWDGCPDPDNDRDGILDGDDKCPNDAEDPDGFQDEDGCPEPDNDGDGVPDVRDRCAMEPEDKDGHDDEDGCPDPDNDGDGIVDGADKCPGDAEDADGFQDGDGCPDPDNDGDGILDTADKCRDQAEDKDGFEDTDGCPEADNDRDGIDDAADECPLEPETINGVDDFDGCPDKGVAKVKLTPFKIEIREKVFFDTGRATIQRRSWDLLGQVSLLMRKYPQINKVRVEGHTDNQGDDASNLTLSQARASAVRQFLIQRGVPRERLEAHGYGETRPIADNRGAAGREKNRRVEFIILEVDGKPVGPEGAVIEMREEIEPAP